MNDLILQTGTAEEFFRRGRLIAKLVDQKRPVQPVRSITFEEPAELLKLLTPVRVELFRAIKQEPGSISAISLRVRRGRSSVKRDIDQLAKFGLIVVEQRVSSSHRRMKKVSVVAQTVRLEAILG